jgi:transcriptional regulator with XRE-family HTH domain
MSEQTAAQHHLIVFLEKQRKRQRISWEAIARQAGMNEKTIFRWRKRKTTPSISDIERVYDVLGFNIVPIRRAALGEKE